MNAGPILLGIKGYGVRSMSIEYALTSLTPSLFNSFTL